jgi:hypothetical protein
LFHCYFNILSPPSIFLYARVFLWRGQVVSDASDGPSIERLERLASLNGLDAPGALLALKDRHMRPKPKLNWAEDLPLAAWDKVEFAAGDGDTAARVVALQLAVGPASGAAGRLFDCELKVCIHDAFATGGVRSAGGMQSFGVGFFSRVAACKS